MKATYLLKRILDGASWAASLNTSRSVRWPDWLKPAPDVIVYLHNGQLLTRNRPDLGRPWDRLVASIFNIDDVVTVVIGDGFEYVLTGLERV